MNINLSKLEDKELAQLCIKHDIIEVSKLGNYTRKQVIVCIETWCKQKQAKYKSHPKSHPKTMSDPNIKSIIVDEQPKSNSRPRRASVSNMQNVKMHKSKMQNPYDARYGCNGWATDNSAVLLGGHCMC